MTWVAAAIGGAQVVGGLVAKGKANKDAKKALAQRKPYEIPQEIYKILNASLSGAQGDTLTENYQTNLIQQQGAAATGVAERLGADPNTLSAIFGQQIGAIGQAAEANHAQRMDSFGKIISAYNLVADNDAARQKSQQDMVKDLQQAAQAGKDSANKMIESGVNAGLAGYSAYKQGQLYKEVNGIKKVAKQVKPIINAGSNLLTNFSPMGTTPYVNGVFDSAAAQALGWTQDLSGSWHPPK